MGRSVYFATAPVIFRHAIIVVVMILTLSAWIGRRRHGSVLALSCGRDGTVVAGDIKELLVPWEMVP